MTASTPFFLIVLALVFVSLVLVVIVMRQKQEIIDLKEAATPKYGFLGKPLMAVGALAVLGTGMALTYHAGNNVEQVQVSADKNVEIEIVLDSQLVDTGDYLVSFSFIPSIEGVVWGSDSATFDAFWNIEGATSVSEIELDLSDSNRGGFSRALPAGSYLVRLDVVYEGRTWPAEQSFRLGN